MHKLSNITNAMHSGGMAWIFLFLAVGVVKKEI